MSSSQSQTKSSLEELEEYTRIAKYATYNQKQQRRETWAEQIDRVIKMHKVKFAHLLDNREFTEALEKTRLFMNQKKVLGSQRALQFAGPPVLNKNTRIYNCSATYIDRPRVFQDIMFVLLCGAGVGFSVQTHHIAKLPSIQPIQPDAASAVFVIPDTIEGWADAIGVLMSSYFTTGVSTEFEKYKGFSIVFDYSTIRPSGAPISHCNGKAPGSKGLELCMENIRNVLKRNTTGRLSPIEAYDIIMHSSDAVLSGGVRRSATLCMFSVDDKEMIQAKTGDWFIKNPQRGRSNNSAVLIRDKTTKLEFDALMSSVQQFGEPGFVWSDDTECLFNPCVPDDTWIQTSKGSVQVKDLINTPFKAVVNGKEYDCKTGFVKTGTNRQTYKISARGGISMSATDNHKILNEHGDWVELKNLNVGDKIMIHEHDNVVTDQSSDDFTRGWLVGFLSSKNETLSDEEKIRVYPIPDSKDVNDYYGGSVRDKCLQARAFIERLGLDRQWPAAITTMLNMYVEDDGKLKDAVERESMDFQAGFVRGSFDYSGSTGQNEHSIKFQLVNRSALCRIQRMLLRLGAMSAIYSDHELVADMRDRNVRKLFAFDRSSRSYAHTYLGTDLRFVVEIERIEPDKICDVYDCTVENIHAFDANGVYVHNCVEIGLYSYDDKGQTGMSFCNLSEINMATVADEKDFYERCEVASIIGTMQAAYTDFGYLGDVTRRIVEKEALIGVSMTGMMDNFQLAFDDKVLSTGAQVVIDTNKAFAKLLGINQAARTTCVKPAGSTSCILNTASGIHPRHSKRYFRRVQSNKNEPPLQYFKSFNPRAVEESKWSSTHSDEVVTFLCEAPNSIYKKDINAIQLLELVKKVQQFWVVPGTVVDLCAKPFLRHNVSNTVTVNTDEWGVVADFIYDNRAFYTGISLLPASGDLDYQQAPFQEVMTHSEIVEKYGIGSMFASGLIVHAHKAFGGNLYSACACLLGYGESVIPSMLDMSQSTGSLVGMDSIYHKLRWLAQSRKFAAKYFQGDMTQLTYCLKHVDACKTWNELAVQYVHVPWDEFKEENDNTNVSQYVACSGNSCEIIKF